MKLSFDLLESRDLPSTIFEQAYSVPPNAGAGEKSAVIIVGSDPTAQQDLNAYDKVAHLPYTHLNIVKLGSVTTPWVDWRDEGALGVEVQHAMAPKAQLTLIEVSNDLPWSLDEGATTAAKLGNNVIAMPYNLDSGWDNWFKFISFTHQLFVSAVGDSPGDIPVPANNPDVLAVGGTVLNVNSHGHYISEAPWKQSPVGMSDDYSWVSPKYAARPLPDVVAGNTAYIYSNGQWEGELGTSVSTEVWAGAADDILAAHGNAHWDEVALLNYVQSHEGDMHHPKNGGAGSPIVSELMK